MEQCVWGAAFVCFVYVHSHPLKVEMKTRDRQCFCSFRCTDAMYAIYQKKINR